jgi:cysteine-rich repeat protein
MTATGADRLSTAASIIPLRNGARGGVAFRALGLVALCACAVSQSSDVSQALSANPCTAVRMTAPAQGFIATPGVPVTLTGSATCPVGQTPEYRYWSKQFTDQNWTILGPYVPGSTTWTPPFEAHWCVTVVARAVGATEPYQVRASAVCNTPRCGNGVIDSGEECDDGNTRNGDACEADCTLPRCGNGILDAGEVCDDGNTSNGDSCEANCTLPFCGNGILDRNEECDDANTTNGDACDTNCTLPRCGNGLVDPGEECDDANTTNGDACDINCTLPRCGNSTLDPGEQCDDGNTTSGDGCDSTCQIEGLTYFKASNTGASDQFGWAMALSADGTTLAIGARGEASAAVGINGNQADNSLRDAGAVYVFVRSGASWIQQAYIKASNTDPDDWFGGFTGGIALSSDGSTLAVGAIGEDSGASGVNGNQADNSSSNTGAVYVFVRNGTTWTQHAYIKALPSVMNEQFGGSVALSGNGSTLAVGAPIEGLAFGAVYVFSRTATTWIQEAHLNSSNFGLNDQLGTSVALSSDGSTLVAGAIGEASASKGINGDQTDNSAPFAGAAYVFTHGASGWTQQAYLKASNPGAGDQFGTSVALSSDGTTLAVGALHEASAATGIGGNQADNSIDGAGAVYVFTRGTAGWSQQAYVKASNTGSLDNFGAALAMSADGSTLAVGAQFESSAAIGIGGNQADNSAPGAGAVYTFKRTGTAWMQLAYLKASNTKGGDNFGACVALSADGTTLAATARFESSAATGVNGNQTNSGASFSGAAYVFR